MKFSRGGSCAYCGVRRAVNRDHVVPQSLAKKRLATHPGQCPCKRCASRRADIPAFLFETVGACFECNNHKGARRLVPPSWADRVQLLNEVFPGTPWRVWSGDVTEPAYREVHLSPSVTSLDVTHCQEPARAE